MDCGEPVGDSVQRLALRLSLLGFYGGGVLAISALFLPRGVFLDPVGGPLSHLPLDPAAHSRAMVLGFCSLFVLSFLCRMVPRLTRSPLARPHLARLGAIALLAASLADVAGAMGWGRGGPWLLGGLWLLALVGWTASLGGTWRGRTAPLPWFAGWISGGLLGLALCVGAAGVSALFGWTEVLGRVPAATLLGALTPIAAGLSVKMLPAMAGVGPANRGAATAPGTVVASVGCSLSLGVLAAQPFLGLVGVLGLVVLAVAALRGTGWLLVRSDGDERIAAARMAPDARSLRWSGRLAWLALGAALIVECVGFAASVWGLGAVAGRPVREVHVLGLHLLGTGFLVTLMLGVGQRLLPGFVKADVRWPRLRHAVFFGMVLTVLLRPAALLFPAQIPWALHAALGTLLFCVMLFHLQVAPSIRSPAEGSAST